MSTDTTPWLEILPPRVNGQDVALYFRTSLGITFCHTFHFTTDVSAALARYPAVQVSRLLDYLALTDAMYLFDQAYFEEVRISTPLTKDERAFFEDFYFQGLAEFRHTNHIPLATKTLVRCPEGEPLPKPHAAPQLRRGALMANGGGKDGAIGSEAVLAAGLPATWFTWNMVGSRVALVAASPIQESLAANSSFDIAPSKNAPFRGHKPLNGALAFLVVLAALVADRRFAIVSNEHSANEANVVVDGININHQYTKSFAVEQSLSQLVGGLGLGVQYFSVLRPLYELQIMRILHDFPRYHQAFISCNHGAKEGYWCLACAKCAFIALCMTAIDPEAAASIWGDQLILAKPELRPHIIELVSPQLDKPFECVGTLEECQLALGMIYRNKPVWQALPADFRQQLTPHLPKDYDALYERIMGTVDRPNNIPADLWPAVSRFFTAHLG